MISLITQKYDQLFDQYVYVLQMLHRKRKENIDMPTYLFDNLSKQIEKIKFNKIKIICLFKTNRISYDQLWMLYQDLDRELKQIL